MTKNIPEAIAVKFLVLFLALFPLILTVTLPSSSRVWVGSQQGLGSNPSEQYAYGHPAKEAESHADENCPMSVGLCNRKHSRACLIYWQYV